MTTITTQQQRPALAASVGRRFRPALALAALMVLGSGSAMAYSLDFELVNRTNQPIVAMWAVPTSSPTWGSAFENVFVPAAGGRQNVDFTNPAYGTDQCTFSIKVRFSEGAERYWQGYNLCSIKGMQIYVSNGEVRASTW